MAQEAAEAEARRFGRAAGLLSIGIGSAGLLTYVYFSLASHNLNRVDYGEVVVLWSAVFITISTLFRPVEQLFRGRSQSARRASSRSGSRYGSQRGSSSPSPPPSPSRPWPCGAPSRTICCRATRPCTGSWSPPRLPLAPASSRAAFWPAAGASPCTPSSCSPSPPPASRLRSRSPSGSPAARPRSRWGSSPRRCSVCMVVPLAFAHRAVARSRAAPARPAPAAGQPEFTLATGSGFAAAVLLIMISEQTLLNAGPLLVKTSEGAAAAGFIFNVLMLARAPLVLFQAVATSLLPHLTRLRSSADAARRGGLSALCPDDDRRDSDLRGGGRADRADRRSRS